MWVFGQYFSETQNSVFTIIVLNCAGIFKCLIIYDDGDTTKNLVTASLFYMHSTQ